MPNFVAALFELRNAFFIAQAQMTKQSLLGVFQKEHIIL